MDSFEWNKIAGAVLFALLIGVGLTIFSDTLFETEAPESPGYIVAVATQEGSPEGGAEAPAASQSIGALLAAADGHAGEASAKKCGACHTFNEGGANKVGPNLYGIVNRPIAAHEGFAYSDALKQYATEAQTWTFENLNAFVHDPKGTVPGTKMAFAGLKNDSERANVLAYMNTQSDSPAPLPEVTEAPAANAEVASAEQTATATDAGTAAPAAAENALPTAQRPPQEEAPAVIPPTQTESAAPAEQQAAEAPTGEQPAQAESPAATAEQPAAPAEQQVAQTEAPAEAPAAAGAGDATKGATFAKRCAACHSFESGGANKVGPHLFGVVGRPIASVADFAYSDAMKKFAEGGKVWDDATLSAYLADPKGSAPGNKMAFPGIKKDDDRANVIAYLNTLK